MKFSTSAAVAALSCTLLISCSTMTSPENAQFAARSPEQVIDAFTAAVNSGDIERVLAVYERDARLAFPGKPYVGHDAIRVNIQNLLSQKPTMRGKTKSVSQVGELALLRSEWSYTGTGAKGERIELSGESTELARRQPDGTWRYVVDLPMGIE
jgi:uncharacterized protein (TIGR02246 family)